MWLNSDGLTNTTNELTPSLLSKKYGLNVANPNDFNLLTQPISSPAVAARGFTTPYSTFPSGATLAQALRPFPQFGSIGDYYEHDGNTWYDALQVKVSKRLEQRTVGRPRLLVVEESGNNHQHWNLYHGDTDTGSQPASQEARNPMCPSTSRRCSTSTSTTRCRDSVLRKLAGSACIVYRLDTPTASSITRAAFRYKHRIRRAL